MSRGRSKQARGIPRSPEDARKAGEAWAAELFAQDGVHAVILEGGESVLDRKTQKRLVPVVRQAMAAVGASVAEGNLDAARAAVAGLPEQGVDWVRWYDAADELGVVLTGCVRLGQVAFADSTYAGLGGAVVHLVLWRE